MAQSRLSSLRCSRSGTYDSCAMAMSSSSPSAILHEAVPGVAPAPPSVLGIGTGRAKPPLTDANRRPPATWRRRAHGATRGQPDRQRCTENHRAHPRIQARRPDLGLPRCTGAREALLIPRSKVRILHGPSQKYLLLSVSPLMLTHLWVPASWFVLTTTSHARGDHPRASALKGRRPGAAKRWEARSESRREGGLWTRRREHTPNRFAA